MFSVSRQIADFLFEQNSLLPSKDVEVFASSFLTGIGVENNHYC